MNGQCRTKRNRLAMPKRGLRPSQLCCGAHAAQDFNICCDCSGYMVLCWKSGHGFPADLWSGKVDARVLLLQGMIMEQRQALGYLLQQLLKEKKQREEELQQILVTKTPNSGL